VRRSAEGVLIGVWDQGRGIPADKLSSVFQEFQRLPEHSAMCHKGMGLGLAIVKRLSLRLNHRLVVRSEFGRGSFFGVLVPYGKAEAARLVVREAASAPACTGAEPKGMTILLIDNEPAILDGMVTLLSGWNCRPLPALGLDQALAQLEWLAAPPDAILADYHLDDGVTGPQVIRALNARLGRPVPAALITADRTDEVKAEADEGGWELLTKPVRPARLRSLIGHFAKLAGAGE
jgi:CheY-like chemotaxis protein